MKYLLSGLFLLNTIICSIIIISSILIIHHNIIYSSNNATILYLCIGFISFTLDVFYLSIKHIPSFELHFNKNIINSFTCFFSFILAIIWLVSSIYMSIISKECINNFGSQICIHYIVNTICGFILMLIWILFICITLKRLSNLYKKSPALEAQASDEISRNI